MEQNTAFHPQRIAVIGAQGAIGKAFVSHYQGCAHKPQIFACAREPATSYSDTTVPVKLNVRDAESIQHAAATIQAPLDLVVVCTGVLHTVTFGPEKTFKALEQENMQTVMDINAIGPAMVMQHFLPLLPRERKAVFAAISARVGSISDNQIGGWYSYRASKAALNMLLRTAAIEMTRKHPHAAVIGLHPGTVDSALSEPFQQHVPAGKLFTPAYSVQQMADVIENLTPDHTGRLFAYDGQEIHP